MRRPVLVLLALAQACTGDKGSAGASSGPAVSSTASAPVASAPASASAHLPDAVSQPSVVEPDPAGPSVLAGEAIDGAALRKRHVARLKDDRSPVTVLKGGTALELGDRICDAVVPKRGPDTPVLLKPNLCGFDGIKDPEKWKGDDGIVGRTTDVEFSRGVVRCLKRRGHRAITIAEGCGHSHAFWKDVAERTGYAAMAREEEVSLVALDDDGVFDVQGEKPGQAMRISGIGNSRVPTLLMPRALAHHLDRGLFLSLPKVKAHRFSVVSLAIKGMQGTVMLSDAMPAYKQKYRMHRELNELIKQKKERKGAASAAGDGGPAPSAAPPPTPEEERKAYVGSLMAFAERMVDVLEISTPDAVLAEGAPGMGGDGFQQMWPTSESFAVGGTNPVLVDRVGAQLLGLSDNPRLGAELLGHKSSPLIQVAAKRFGIDLGKTQVTGDGADLLSTPRPAHFKSMAGFSIHSDATPAWTPIAPKRAPAREPVATAAPSAPAAPTATAAPSAATDKPEAHAVAAGARTVNVDGLPDDAVWADAKAVEWSTDYAGTPTKTSTRARFAWSTSGLHVLFELSGAGLFSDRTKPIAVEREKLYEEDCVEIFFTPDPAAPARYFEVEIGPFGHFFDLDVHKGKKSSTAWSSGARIGAKQDPKARRAVIEATLSSRDVTRALVAGARLPLGLYRMEGASPRQYLAWRPPRTAKPNFHVPEAFGVLVLDP